MVFICFDLKFTMTIVTCFILLNLFEIYVETDLVTGRRKKAETSLQLLSGFDTLDPFPRCTIILVSFALVKAKKKSCADSDLNVAG